MQIFEVILFFKLRTIQQKTVKPTYLCPLGARKLAEGKGPKGRKISSFGIAPVKKKHIRLGHAGIMDHSVDLSMPDLKKKYKKGMDRCNKKFKNIK